MKNLFIVLSLTFLGKSVSAQSEPTVLKVEKETEAIASIEGVWSLQDEKEFFDLLIRFKEDGTFHTFSGMAEADIQLGGSWSLKKDSLTICFEKSSQECLLYTFSKKESSQFKIHPAYKPKTNTPHLRDNTLYFKKENLY